MRVATVERNTKETQITGRVDLDGTGAGDIATGIGFLDHMLEQLAKHSLIDLKLRASGDLHIDFHHTTEDTGYVVGEAVSRALGEPRRDRALWPCGDPDGRNPDARQPRRLEPTLSGVEGGVYPSETRRDGY